MTALFWLSFLLAGYAYLGYPVLLWLLGRGKDEGQGAEEELKDEGLPTLSLVMPVFNGEAVIAGKVRNTLDLDYPAARMEVIVVSDGSRDGTGEIVKGFRDERIRYLETGERKGKAEALNLALRHAGNEIVVFSDASIRLEKDALRKLVGRFRQKNVGCVSGEDYIEGPGGEGLYGRYELFLRRQESRIGSIVGASGCFYAERRSLVDPFRSGMAPDFLSVLRVVEKGYRAVSEKSARGSMGCLQDTGKEFSRKVRTFNRGMAALWHKKHLMDPFRYGLFALELLSHKLLRWSVPFFMIGAYLSSAVLMDRTLYLAAFAAQSLFYGAALLAWFNPGGIGRAAATRVPLYFTTVNAALLLAWYRYARGVREEIWEPTERP